MIKLTHNQHKQTFRNTYELLVQQSCYTELVKTSPSQMTSTQVAKLEVKEHLFVFFIHFSSSLGNPGIVEL